MNSTLEKHSISIKTALLIREVEQKLLGLFAEGKLFGTVHTCIGQEFIGVSVARCLKSNDTIFSNHRGHGHFIAHTRNVTGLIAEVMGKSIGVCGGRGGSQHLYQNNFYSNGIQGGIVPVSAGLAFGQKINKNNAISVVFIGDGTLGEGALYESMNIASKWNLPILIVCENNLYSQSTAQAEVLAGNICDRAEAFGIETKELNTWDWENLLEEMEACVNYVRENSRPFFCKVNTYRLMAHSKGDDNRDKTEIDAYWEKDPLNVLKEKFKGNAEFENMQIEISEMIKKSVELAENSNFTEIDQKIKLKHQEIKWGKLFFQKERAVTLIKNGLENALDNYEKVIMIGEDIKSPYGGAFKCTAGLSAKYPERVFNTPISEAAISGIGNGLALSGFKPVVEIMFGDFMTLVADQWINHASKFKWMYNDQVEVPIVFRTPMGGNRGYGPTHSQSLEKHFLGVPGTRVLCLNHRYNPEFLYDKLFELGDIPTLVIENKVLYGKYISTDVNNGFELLFSNEQFPTVFLKPNEPAQITFIAIGGVSTSVEEAVHRLFEEEEIVAEVFMPTQLYPFSISYLKENISNSKKLIIVEEGQGFVSISSEIIAQVAEEMSTLGIAVTRVVSNVSHIPTSRPMEEASLVNTEKIFNKAKEFYYANS